MSWISIGKLEETKAKSEKEKGNDREKNHYKNALKHYEKINKIHKLFKLNYIIYKKDIEKIIKSNEFQETIEYYQQIFDILKHLMKDEYSKYVYTIISEYLIMLVRLSIISFKKIILFDLLSI